VNERTIRDASALLVSPQEEKGAERVAEALPEAQIGAVNFSEVFGKLVEVGLDEETIGSLVESLQRQVIPFDREQARLAGSLRRATREWGLSLGGRACLALARVQGAAALTCDRSWTRFDAGCRVELAR
jgi:ribonuclease VapC